MSKKTLILFDFDGTIADSAALAIELGNQVLKEHGAKQVPESDFETMRNKSPRELIKELGIPLYKVPAVVASARKLLRQHIERIEPIEGMVDLVREFAERPNVQVSVLTSNSRENVDFFLKKHEISSVFASIHADVGLFSKFTKIRKISRTEGKGMRVISVGDETRDVEAARIAKVPSIAVSWGLSAPKKLKQVGATVVVNSADELRHELNKQLDRG